MENSSYQCIFVATKLSRTQLSTEITSEYVKLRDAQTKMRVQNTHTVCFSPGELSDREKKAKNNKYKAKSKSICIRTSAAVWWWESACKQHYFYGMNCIFHSVSVFFLFLLWVNFHLVVALSPLLLTAYLFVCIFFSETNLNEKKTIHI